MRGREVRALLAETAALLGDRPWGVGILGFVPPELREEQLEVIREVQPPVALIAGGRPAQAAPLEAEGIHTYLHVPSPGLLEQFANAGARRFVFEGRECGGHVGPRIELRAVGGRRSSGCSSSTASASSTSCSPAASTTRARRRWSPRWPRRSPTAAHASAC